MIKAHHVTVIVVVSISASTLCPASTGYTAASLDQSDVQAAVTSCEFDPECTHVFLPPGSSPPWTDDIDFSGGMIIEGAGVDQTTINLAPSLSTGFQNSDARGQVVEFGGFRINATDRSSSATAIYLRHTGQTPFRIHDIYFFGRFYPTVDMKYCWKGLIDHCVIEDDDPTVGSQYGVTMNGPTVGRPTCSTWTDPACTAAGDAWWDDTSIHQGFDENYVPGTENAVFIEDCRFINCRSAVMWNWGNVAAVVIRHNEFFLDVDVPFFGTKNGTVWCEIYDNTVTWTGPGQEGVSLRIRNSGLVYHNTFVNLRVPGYIENSRYYSGYMFTLQTFMDELYIWDNTYINCVNSGDDLCQSTTCGWREVSDEFDDLQINDEYFFRAPQIGDRIYPYTPFPYPHPANTNTIFSDGFESGDTGGWTSSGSLANRPGQPDPLSLRLPGQRQCHPPAR